MSASGLMSIGVRAMNANYVGLQTSGHNIANAGVEGYSRQQVDLQTALGQFTGAGFFGKGVDVKTVARVYDQFLTREAMTSRAQSSFDTARLDRLQQLESLFAGGDDGTASRPAPCSTRWSISPATRKTLASRNVVLGRAGELAARFSTAAAQLDDIQSGVTQELGAMVAQVNEIARQIASVNDRIAIAQGTGHTPNDLLDQRDRLLSDLSSHVQITTVAADDGSVSVFVGGGQRLVLGGQASQLQVAADPYDASRVALGIQDGASVRPLSAALVGGGSIGGLLRFQDEDLVRARTMLGQLGAAITAASTCSSRSASTSACRRVRAHRCSRSARRRPCLPRRMRAPRAVRSYHP
jgi:flagellar hook-associated protein 1 FlgK